MANNQVFRILISCNRKLLLIKIYAGISNIFKKVHDLIKLQASNEGLKQILFLLFSNFLTKKYSLPWSIHEEFINLDGIFSLKYLPLCYSCHACMVLSKFSCKIEWLGMKNRVLFQKCCSRKRSEFCKRDSQLTIDFLYPDVFYHARIFY